MLFGPKMEKYSLDLPQNKIIFNRSELAEGEGFLHMDVCESSKERLIRLAKKGDMHARSVLFKLSRGLIEKAVDVPLWGYGPESRRFIAQTALFEMMCEGDFSALKEEGVRALSKRMRKRKKEEVPSWLSLNQKTRRRNPGDNDEETLIDTIYDYVISF